MPRTFRQTSKQLDLSFRCEFKHSLAEACERGEFRVCHDSLQRDHVHLVVDAAGKPALGRGMKAIGALDPAEVPGTRR